MDRVFIKGIRAALIADGTVNGLVSTRIYAELAPKSASYPYIVIDLSAGVSPNLEPGEAKDYRYIVRAVSNSQVVAAQVASAVYDALHHATLDFDSPWLHLQTQHESEFKFTEDAEREKLYHRGGLFRIRANK